MHSNGGLGSRLRRPADSQTQALYYAADSTALASFWPNQRSKVNQIGKPVPPCSLLPYKLFLSATLK